MSNNIFDCINVTDRAAFFRIAKPMLEKQIGMSLDDDAVNVEEIDQHWKVAYATGDVGSVNGPAVKTITLELSPIGNLALQTQDPKLNGSAVNAADSILALFGIALQLDQAALTVPFVRTILQDLSVTKLRAFNGNNRRFEILATTALGCGPDVLTDSAVAAGRLPSASPSVRKFGAPFTVGKDQVFKIEHVIGRTTAWPAAFSLDIFAPGLVMRKK